MILWLPSSSSFSPPPPRPPRRTSDRLRTPATIGDPPPIFVWRNGASTQGRGALSLAPTCLTQPTVERWTQGPDANVDALDTAAHHLSRNHWAACARTEPFRVWLRPELVDVARAQPTTAPAWVARGWALGGHGRHRCRSSSALLGTVRRTLVGRATSATATTCQCLSPPKFACA